jgi:hypothetical protein
LALRLLAKLHKEALCLYRGNPANDFTLLFERQGGLDAAESLLYHPERRVYKQALRLIEKYYEKVD